MVAQVAASSEAWRGGSERFGVIGQAGRAERIAASSDFALHGKVPVRARIGVGGGCCWF